MINVYNYEDKTADDCRMKCLEELDVYDDEIITRDFEEDGVFKIEVIKIARTQSVSATHINVAAYSIREQEFIAQ